MMALFSPAKNMTAAAPPQGLSLHEPYFREKAAELAAALKAYAPWQLETLLDTSPAIAMRAYMDYQAFHPAESGTAALLAYSGLAFRYLEAGTLSEKGLAYADRHVRIASALYGLLRPLDGILPYRLEMMSRLRMDGQNLYAYWGEAIYRRLFAEDPVVINLASAEYARMVTPYLQRGDRFITCDFLAIRRGKRVMPATAAKMARGKMVRYMVDNRVEEPEKLQAFDWDGYAFCPELSMDDRYVFLRT